jgi:hypothetical protein
VNGSLFIEITKTEFGINQVPVFGALLDFCPRTFNLRHAHITSFPSGIKLWNLTGDGKSIIVHSQGAISILELQSGKIKEHYLRVDWVLKRTYGMRLIQKESCVVLHLGPGNFG